MKVELLQPDIAPAFSQEVSRDGGAFANALGSVMAQLKKATSAEDSFANGHGSLQAAMYERARADVALSVATATAQRVAQGINTLLNMQL